LPKKNTQTIEIGCPPGSPRPGDLLPDVIKGTGLEVRSPDHMAFGDWEWDYSDIDPEKWKEIKPIIKERLCKLYDDGVVRYVSW